MPVIVTPEPALIVTLPLPFCVAKMPLPAPLTEPAGVIVMSPPAEVASMPSAPGRRHLAGAGDESWPAVPVDVASTRCGSSRR